MLADQAGTEFPNKSHIMTHTVGTTTDENVSRAEGVALKVMGRETKEGPGGVLFTKEQPGQLGAANTEVASAKRQLSAE